MGNRLYVSRIRIIGILSIAAAFLLIINPFFADAARSQALVDRLCNRQASLAGRLVSNLIDPSACQPTPPTEPTLSFTATPTTINQGAASTLAWSSTNATSCTASNGWSGAKALSGTLPVSPSATTTYALSCTGAGGSVAKSVTVNVNVTPLPVPTLTFTATPGSIQAGASSTLAWSTTNATSCTASNGWTGSKATSGSQSVSPSATTTYALDCTGAGGSVHQEATVNVSAAPVPSLTFTANPLNVLANGTTTLTWSSTNTSLCVAANGWTGNKATSGSLDVAVAATSTYALSCGGANGTTSASVTVNVTPHPLPTVTLTANPINVTPGAGSATSTLSWTSTNATACTAFNGWSGSKATSGSEIVSPNATTTYQLDCSGPGGVGSDDAIVNFVPTPAGPLPGITFSAAPTNVTPGPGSATSTLTWSTTNADVCIASNGWSGTKVLAGTTIVQPLATTTYQLDCGNATGTTTANATVNFVPTPAPAVNHLLISEVYYDVDVTHGADTANEWLELYNPTASLIDLSSWAIADGSTYDKFPNGTTIPAGGFLVITAASTTSGFWGVPVVSFESAIGNGLANGGDTLHLLDITGATTTVDAMSWGSNTSIFTLPAIAEGHSLFRSSLNADTDLASDWADDATPAPGQAN